MLADAYVPGSSANFYPMGLAATGNGKLLAADGGGSYLTKILEVTAGGSPASAPVRANLFERASS